MSEEKQPGPAKSGRIIEIDEAETSNLLDRKVRESEVETLNAMLHAEADELCGAKRYERSPDRVDIGAGSYDQKLHAKAGEVKNVSVLVAIGVNEEG